MSSAQPEEATVPIFENIELKDVTEDRMEGTGEIGPSLFLFADPDPPSKRSRWRRLTTSLRQRLSCLKVDPELKRKALVTKNGSYRVHTTGLSEHKRRFLADIYITLIDLPWRYAIAILFNAFLFSFLFFAVLWWLMGHANGDFDNYDNSNHTACLNGIRGFAGAILFSIETQTTIGYGFAYPNATCALTLPLLYFQVVIGFLLETVMLGFLFVKLARPKYRAHTLLFSKHAVICIENGEPCLQVRVGDLRKSHLVDAKITAMVIRKHSSPEGAFYPLYQQEVVFQANGMGDRILLMWPIILTHRITPDSPLYDMRPDNIARDKQFEIVLFLTGIVEATGEVCQARTSYTPREILWGHRFERVEEYDIKHCRWYVDFSCFDDVIYCQNIRHSARELALLKETQLPTTSGDVPETQKDSAEDVKEAGAGAAGVSSPGAKPKTTVIPRDVKSNEYYQMALRLFRDK